MRAKELGVDLSTVQPTGPDGTVTRADVEAAAATRPSAEAATPLRGARRTMALNMARAWREVAHATLHDEVDVDGWFEREDVTARLIRAMIAGCAAEPSLNASFDAAASTLKNNAGIDLGLAIDSPDGLFVPVLRDVARSSAADWRREIEAVKKGVSERSLAPDGCAARPSRCRISARSPAGTRRSSSCRRRSRSSVPAGLSIVRRAASAAWSMHRTLPLSLTFDHRAITGGQAARFLRAVMSDLERPN